MVVFVVVQLALMKRECSHDRCRVRGQTHAKDRCPKPVLLAKQRSCGEQRAKMCSECQSHTALTPLNSGEKLCCQHRDSFAVRLGGTVYKAN